MALNCKKTGQHKTHSERNDSETTRLPSSRRNTRNSRRSEQPGDKAAARSSAAPNRRPQRSPAAAQPRPGNPRVPSRPDVLGERGAACGERSSPRAELPPRHPDSAPIRRAPQQPLPSARPFGRRGQRPRPRHTAAGSAAPLGREKEAAPRHGRRRPAASDRRLLRPARTAP